MRFLWILFSSHMLLQPAYGQNDDRYNYRDQCRSIIAGSYWKLVDQTNNSHHFLTLHKNKMLQLQKEKERTTAQLKAEQSKRQKDKLNPGLDNQIRILEGRLDLIKKNYDEHAAKIPEREAELKLASQERDAMRARIVKVFHLEEKSSSTGGEVPKAFEYKTTCPPYRHTCPLPEAERKALLDIFTKETVPTPCLRYSYIR